MLHQIIVFTSINLLCFSFLVFRKYDPDVMATSLDEAYLDITEVCRERSISSAEVS